jgi:hypothetical protein
MAENKTKPTGEPVANYLNKIENEQVRQDCWRIIEMMQDVTKTEATMWGPSIIGFGTYHYVYESGREGDSVWVGFSPRKQNITLYIMGGFDNYEKLIAGLGKYSRGKGCIYIKRLSDIDSTALKELIRESVAHVIEKYGK